MNENIYLDFVKFPRSEGKVTDIWEIQNKDHTTILGYIKWHGAWRKYAFFPEPRTLWDNKCLTEVQQFVDKQMTLRKKK